MKRFAAVTLLALGLTACGGENHYESLANSVTKAVVANDMRPVLGDFNAATRPQLENRVKVAQLSDDLNALGAYKGVHEDTPAGSEAGHHTFAVVFEKGTWREDMALDSDGKIVSFHIRAPDSAPTQ